MHSRDPVKQADNNGAYEKDDSLKRYKSSSILAWISAKRFIILYCWLATFIAFIFFLFLHWITKGPAEVVENKEKEKWQQHPIKYKMGNIRVGLRIMPSANTENNMIMMDESLAAEICDSAWFIFNKDVGTSFQMIREE